MGIYWRKGAYNVEVYDPLPRRNVYVGRRKLERDAKVLLREKEREFASQDRKAAISIREYVERWLELKHGPRTRRPAPSTRAHNRVMLGAFLDAYGDHPLDGGIGRAEALDWAARHPYNAYPVSAMFNDAVDDQLCRGNPFANRRQQQSRERKDIHPLTEEEVDRFAEIARERWGPRTYGLVARAWVLFGAWVGCRPGETFQVKTEDLDLESGEVTIRRVKKRGVTHPTDVVVLADAAKRAILDMPDIPVAGPLFRTVTGRPMVRGALRYHWDPVRSAFRKTVTPERWDELLGGQDNLDFYVLRHFVASVMADRGASARDIAHQLGNSVEVCEATYVHSYRDRINDRNRRLLERQIVVELDAHRNRGA
jgi:integrase